jgi:hypothetical protein
MEIIRLCSTGSLSRKPPITLLWRVKQIMTISQILTIAQRLTTSLDSQGLKGCSSLEELTITQLKIRLLKRGLKMLKPTPGLGSLHLQLKVVKIPWNQLLGSNRPKIRAS